MKEVNFKTYNVSKSGVSVIGSSKKGIGILIALIALLLITIGVWMANKSRKSNKIDSMPPVLPPEMDYYRNIILK